MTKFKFTIDVNFLDEVNWAEAKHPRGQPGNAGEFTSGSGGGNKTAPPASKKVATAPRLGPKASFTPLTRGAGGFTGPGGAAVPDHIKNLKVPPAWTNLRYNPDPNGTVYVSGRDTKNRPVVVPNLARSEVNAKAKYARLEKVDDNYDSIHDKNEAGRRSMDPKTRDAADVAKLVMEMGLRPGSTRDTKANQQAYGATTLKGRHVVVDEAGKPSLQFVGKKGVNVHLPVNDPDIAKMLTSRAAHAGPEGDLFPMTNDKSLLAHMKSIGGSKTKDFRTLVGTRTAQKVMESIPAPTNHEQMKLAVRQVAKETAKALGNTWQVALESYISPMVWAPWKASVEGHPHA